MKKLFAPCCFYRQVCALRLDQNQTTSEIPKNINHFYFSFLLEMRIVAINNRFDSSFFIGGGVSSNKGGTEYAGFIHDYGYSGVIPRIGVQFGIAF